MNIHTKIRYFINTLDINTIYLARHKIEYILGDQGTYVRNGSLVLHKQAIKIVNKLEEISSFT